MQDLEDALSYFPSTKNKSFIRAVVDDNEIYGPMDSSSPGDGEDQLIRVGFEKTMSNIAASLTQYGLKKSNNSVNGAVHVTKVFVNVRWSWLILPGILLIVGTIFLVITIVAGKRYYAPLWKSSALAPYYHGIENNDENDHHELSTPSAMDKDAETEYVQLKRSENNGRIMLLRRQAEQKTTETTAQQVELT